MFKKYFWIIVLQFVFIKTNFATHIIAGPIVGAVKSNEAKIVFFTNDFANVEIELCNDTNFIYTLNFKTQTNTEQIVHYKIENLQPKTNYFYRIKLNEILQPSIYSFTTFPLENQTTNFSFAFGSCSENYRNDTIFNIIEKHQPQFFIHLGDWNYPDQEGYPIKPTGNPEYYSANIEKVKASYITKYTMPNAKIMLQNIPVDYVFDDDDLVADDCSRFSHTILKMNGKNTTIQEILYPDSLRNNVLKGLINYFPSYSDTIQQAGAFHSFKYGNVEFFFVDSRSARSPNTEIFTKKKNGKYKYKMPKNHSILGKAQEEWLLNGLKNSTATWKIICSGTNFNKSYKKILDIAMQVQKRILPNKLNGSYIAATMSALWCTYPQTQGKIINFCRANNIKNVAVISGDAHVSAIDNGKNAGFPELMSGNLAQENSTLTDIIYNDIRLNLWNQGGQGINNQNTNNCFGKIEFFNNDSLKMSIIDETNTILTSYVLEEGFLPKKYNINRKSRITFIDKLRAYKNMFKIGFNQLRKKRKK